MLTKDLHSEKNIFHRLTFKYTIMSVSETDGLNLILLFIAVNNL